jgi:hypothetical protein
MPVLNALIADRMVEVPVEERNVLDEPTDDRRADRFDRVVDEPQHINRGRRHTGTGRQPVAVLDRLDDLCGTVRDSGTRVALVPVLLTADAGEGGGVLCHRGSSLVNRFA